jgi:hypothetical protein
MREWGKTIAMDLIRWVLLIFDLLKLQQFVAGNPSVGLDIPSLTAILVPVPARIGGRLSRGPTALHHRSDL